MESDTKSLKTCSIEEMENAIAKAIAELTNTKVDANVTLFKKSDSTFSVLTSGKEQFELSVSLRVGVSYGSGLDTSEDNL